MGSRIFYVQGLQILLYMNRNLKAIIQEYDMNCVLYVIFFIVKVTSTHLTTSSPLIHALVQSIAIVP